MPKLRMKAKNLTAEQIDAITEFMFTKVKGKASFKVRPDFGREVIEQLGWEYLLTDEIGIMEFERHAFTFLLFPNGTARINEETKTVIFQDIIKSRGHLKKVMKILAI